METNLELGEKQQALRMAAEELLDAAMKYWGVYQKTTGGNRCGQQHRDNRPIVGE